MERSEKRIKSGMLRLEKFSFTLKMMMINEALKSLVEDLF
jgi:hypothetical protein